MDQIWAANRLRDRASTRWRAREIVKELEALSPSSTREECDAAIAKAIADSSGLIPEWGGFLVQEALRRAQQLRVKTWQGYEKFAQAAEAHIQKLEAERVAS